MRIPVATTLKNRNSTTAKDARLVNAYAETKDGVLRVHKRPALNQAAESLSGGGQLITTVTDPDGDETVVVITDDDLTNAITLIPSRLGFSVQPPAGRISTALSPAVVVRALTSGGAVVPSFTGNVTLAFDDNPTSSTLGGTLTVAAAAGVATFSNVTSTRSGEGFSLIATASSVKSAVSNSFNIPTQLAFTVQPSDTQPNTAFSVTVAAQDTGGTTDTRYTGFITLAIYSGAGGTLGGNLQRLAVSGEATFPDLTIDVEGTYTLVATAEADSGIDCYKPAARVSNTFSISSSYSYTMVSALSGGGSIGFVDSSFGSLTPTTYLGNLIGAIYNGTPGPSNGLIVEIAGATGQSFFTSITVGGITRLSADAIVYTPGHWEWDGATVITTEGSIAVSITP